MNPACKPVTRLLALTTLLAAWFCPYLACAQSGRVYVTSAAGARIAPGPALHFSKAAPATIFHIDEKVRHQEMIGFGASFLEAGMICLNSLDAPQQEKVLQALFDPRQGAGFTAMKTVIGATDFMSAGPFYTYNDHPGDVEMKNFSIARDLEPNGLIPYIKRARRYGKFVLQAPMDYPPDWMLVDASDRKKQDVDTKYFDALALYYLRYLQEYQKHGVFIDYLSLFNEPTVYTQIPTPKVRDLLKDHVGPLLEKEGIKTRIQPCEYSTREQSLADWPIILDDPQARRYSHAIAYHGYDFKDHSMIGELHRRYPDLKLWMTEICHVRPPVKDYADGDFWGQQIFNDIENGTSAWIYWNMILDEKGGPWLVSEIHGDPDPNIQHPVVIVDRKTKEVTYTALYYYLTHFSKFVRPGAVRIGTTGEVAGTRVLAFQAPDGSIVVELMNSGPKAATIGLEWHGKTAELTLPERSISTAIWK